MKLQPDEFSENNLSTEASSFSHAKFGYFSVILIFLVYQFAGEALLTLLARDGSQAMRAFVQGLGQMVFMLVPAVVIMQYSPLRVHGLMRFRGQVSGLQWLLGLLGIIALQLFAQGFIGIQEQLVPEALYPLYKRAEALTNNAYKYLLGGETIWDAARAFVVGAVIPAFSEEILFRGVLQRSLEQVYSPRRAIVATALLFGALHLNVILVVPLVMIGVYLGYLAYHTQSLGLPIVAHFLNNAVAIIMMYVPEHAVPDVPDGALLASGFVLLVLILWVFRRTQRAPSILYHISTQ